MALYEERLAKDLARINEEVAALSAAVETAFRNAVKACLEGDKLMANAAVIGDKPINRRTREISRLCYAFLAVHQPGAGHLRQIASTLRLVAELERIGDYAVTIARESIQLPHLPSGLIRDELVDMAEKSQTCLERAMVAFNQRNAELARDVAAMAAQAKGRGDMVFTELVEASDKNPEDIRFLFDMLIIMSRLKRVGDRAKNICEETIFTTTGETKAPGIYKILFLDDANNCQSQLAEAFARRAFPNSGEYSSAGRANNQDMAPGLMSFMESQGLVTGPMKPKVLDADVDKASIYDVIVSFQGPVSNYLPGQPFRTVFLDWNVGDVPQSEDDASQYYMAMYREITAQVRNLMETLRGPGAD